VVVERREEEGGPAHRLSFRFAAATGRRSRALLPTDPARVVHTGCPHRVWTLSGPSSISRRFNPCHFMRNGLELPSLTCASLRDAIGKSSGTDEPTPSARCEASRRRPRQTHCPVLSPVGVSPGRPSGAPSSVRSTPDARRPLRSTSPAVFSRPLFDRRPSATRDSCFRSHWHRRPGWRGCCGEG
jgi:hypothetical protein